MIGKLSYPVELTAAMTGWQLPVETLLLNSYLDEIPYKLENTLWATTRQISNRRLGLCNSNWLVKQLLGASNQPLGVDDACTEGAKKKAYLPCTYGAKATSVPGSTYALLLPKEWQSSSQPIQS